MKNIVIVVLSILLLLGVVGFLSQLLQHSQQLTKEQFEERDAYLNKRIDSLKAIILIMEQNQDTIKHKLDTLKYGQKIIFDEVKKASDINFWDLFNF